MSVVYGIADDVNIIDFNARFTEKTYIDVLNDLHNLGILNGKITQDVKRIIYHHIIYDICELYLNSPLVKPVILYTPHQIDSCALFNYFTETEILELITSIIKKIQKYLPIRCYISKYSGKHIKYNATTSNGNVLNVIERIREISLSPIKTEMTFEGIKKFTKKYGLTYLSQDYFARISVKHLYIC